MRTALLVVVAVVGCSKPAPAPTSREVTGTFSVDGKPVAIAECVTGHGLTTYVALVTAPGTLRFEDRRMFWQRDPKAIDRGDELSCARLERSWGGGQRADGTAYFRGRLHFDCTGAAAVAGDVTVDCGHITPEERAQLDANRKELLDEQRGSGSAGSAAAP